MKLSSQGKESFYLSLGKQIRDIRLQRDWSIDKAAAHLRLSTNEIDCLENRAQTISKTSIGRLFEILLRYDAKLEINIRPCTIEELRNGYQVLEFKKIIATLCK